MYADHIITYICTKYDHSGQNACKAVFSECTTIIHVPLPLHVGSFLVMHWKYMSSKTDKEKAGSACLHLCNLRAGYMLQLFQMEATISKHCGLQPTRAIINTIQQE